MFHLCDHWDYKEIRIHYIIRYEAKMSFLLSSKFAFVGIGLLQANFSNNVVQTAEGRQTYKSSHLHGFLNNVSTFVLQSGLLCNNSKNCAYNYLRIQWDRCLRLFRRLRSIEVRRNCQTGPDATISCIKNLPRLSRNGWIFCSCYLFWYIKVINMVMLWFLLKFVPEHFTYWVY